MNVGSREFIQAPGPPIHCPDVIGENSLHNINWDPSRTVMSTFMPVNYPIHTHFLVQNLILCFNPRHRMQSNNQNLFF